MIFGTVLSCLAALALAASCLSAEREAIYFFQCVQCILLAASSVFFASYAALPVLLLCALRNALAAKDRFPPRALALFLPAVLALCVLFNNRGWVGLLPGCATAEITVGAALARSERATKGVLCGNLLLWSVYGFLISDFVTGGINAALLPICLLGALRPRSASESG